VKNNNFQRRLSKLTGKKFVRLTPRQTDRPL